MNFADWILFESLPVLIAIFIQVVANLPWPTTIFTLTYNLNAISEMLSSFVLNISWCKLFLNVSFSGTGHILPLGLSFLCIIFLARSRYGTRQPFWEVVWCDLRLLPLFLFKEPGTSFLFQGENGLFRNLITVNTLGLFKIGFQEAVGRVPSNIYRSPHSEWS